MTSTVSSIPQRPSRLLRAIFKRANAIQTGLYRLTGGAIGHRFRGGTLLLLTTTGRRTGKPHTVPVMYIADGDRLIVLATYGGQEFFPAWYHNLTSQPEATVQIERRHFKVRAAEASGEEYQRLWTFVVGQVPLFEGYRKKLQRRIPIMILHPDTEPSEGRAG